LFADIALLRPISGRKFAGPGRLRCGGPMRGAAASVALCAVAGVLASAAAKVAFGAEEAMRAARWLCELAGAAADGCGGGAAHWLVRALALAAVLALNSLMVQALLRSMHLAGTVRAVTQVNGLSFVLSGLLGFALWGEPLSLRWLLGIALIVSGVFLLQLGAEPGESRRSRPKPD
jgi:drug/metabolite transporter (DMT)-like permease